MNILSLFVLIPLLMLLGLWIARNVNQVRGVMVAGSTLLLALAAYLTVSYIGQRHAGATAEMLFTDSIVWYAPLHICYSVGVDGISVVMLLLSSIIVFTGTFASWKLKPLTKEYFLWFTLLSTGVFGFFISTDLFTMFMFYEVALIPMYLLIGVWGSGRKEYAAMKLNSEIARADGWFCLPVDWYLRHLLRSRSRDDEYLGNRAAQDTDRNATYLLPRWSF